MATRYSKEKYARIKDLKNEPLSNIATDSKKRKLGEEKGETAALPSLEVTAFTPLLLIQKVKAKLGEAFRTTLPPPWAMLIMCL